MHHLTTLRQARRFVFTPLQALAIAEVGTSGGAIITVATKDRETGDHMVARLDITYLGAHCLDNASGFVSEHDRHRSGIECLLEVDIAMAHTSGNGVHEYFMRARGTDVNVLDAKRCMHLT
jgi:hypothetical protein